MRLCLAPHWRIIFDEFNDGSILTPGRFPATNDLYLGITLRARHSRHYREAISCVDPGCVKTLGCAILAI
jgi:hypothetical protein